MNADVEDIKSRLSIREVIGGYMQLVKAGTSWKGLCPFHHEKTPSFVVNEERSSWHCFGCGKGGDVFSFVMESDGLSFPEALALLAERAGVELPKRISEWRNSPGVDMHAGVAADLSDTAEASSPSKQRVFEVVELASKFFEKQLWEGMGVKRALPYLRGRGISDEFLRMFRIGFAPPGWRSSLDFFLGRGFSFSEVEAAGLVIKKVSGEGNESGISSGLSAASRVSPGYDRFRDRITFPVCDIAGRVIGFSARVLPGADESSAKYINTPETLLYHKSKALYGLFQSKRALRDEGRALFVEGNMDVIAMHQAGFPNTIAVSGTALAEGQLRIIHRFADKLSLFFDMDLAGQKAARKSAELALSLGFSVSIVSIEGGKDAAELALHDAGMLRESVASAIPAPEYFLRAALRTHDARTAEGKRYITEDMVSLIGFVSNDIERSHWIKVASDRIGVSEAVIIQMMGMRPAVSRRDDGDAPESMLASRQALFEAPVDRIVRDIAGIVLAFPALLPMPLESATDLMLAALSRSDVVSFLSDETPDHFSFSNIPPEFRDEAARLAFLGEKLVGSGGSSEAADMKIVRDIFATLWRRLNDEVQRESMRDIERKMHEAREHGDRENERRLAELLIRVGRGESIQDT